MVLAILITVVFYPGIALQRLSEENLIPGLLVLALPLLLGASFAVLMYVYIYLSVVQRERAADVYRELRP